VRSKALSYTAIFSRPY